MPVKLLKPGMIVAYPVFGAKGELLLKRGTELTSHNIDALHNRKILALYVKTSLMNDEELYEAKNVIEESVRIEALALVQEWNEQKNAKTYTRIEETVNEIINEILKGKALIYGLAEICTVDAYTYAHSVDVCILATIIGCHLKYARTELIKLALGSMLHDLGKSKIDNELLNKPERLTNVEMSRVRQHPELGYEMLKEYDDVNPISREIVLNHHERYDGSGYPKGIKEEQIHQYSLICGIADVYNAMITDRVYRKALPVNEVYEMLMASGNQLFPMWTVKAFLECVSPYPVGTLVKLSTGDIALVVAIDHSLPLRPEVMILETSEKLKLSRELSVTIDNLSAEEIMQHGQIPMTV